jgi:hypothetical protein
MPRILQRPRHDPRGYRAEPQGAVPEGAALVARAVLRARLRHVIAETCIACTVAAALERKAARGDDRVRP